MKAPVNEVKGNERFGLSFIVCFNAEAAGVKVEGTGYTEKDAIGAAADSAGEVIQDAGYDYELDSSFRNWNGGRHGQFADVKARNVTGWVFARECDEDEEWGDWKPILKKDIPAAILVEGQRVADLASDAMLSQIELIAASAEPASE